ncbi:MAG: hydroxymethylbilane synthase [Kineosporiaceae bacterium]
MLALRLGTRRSALARAQSQWVADRIEKAAADAGQAVRVELVDIVTHGDTSSAPLASLGGVGVFVSRLREALLAGDVDLAVHSLKDLPTAPAAGLVLAAVPTREDPRDVLVARDALTLAALPTGSRVGTGSPRRAAQLRALGLASGRILEVVDVRGNVDTRLRLVADRRLDAVLLARAGLARLGRLEDATEVLDPVVMLPAPGQGALAVECRDPGVSARAADPVLDAAVLAAVRPLDDPATRAAVTAERRVLAAVEAGCSAPLGALAEVMDGDDGPRLTLRAVAAAVDGSVTLRRSLTGPAGDPEGLGNAVAALLVEDGAGDLVPSSGAPVASRPAGGDGSAAQPPPESTTRTTRTEEGDQ